MTTRTLINADIDSVLEKLAHSSDELKQFRNSQPALASTLDDIAASMAEANASPQAWTQIIGNFVYKCVEQANA